VRPWTSPWPCAPHLTIGAGAQRARAGNGKALQNLVLTVCACDGDLQFSSGAFAAVEFADSITGPANGGFVIRLDAGPQFQAAPAFVNPSNVVGLSATGKLAIAGLGLTFAGPLTRRRSG
jgi:hypothetical protein